MRALLDGEVQAHTVLAMRLKGFRFIRAGRNIRGCYLARMVQVARDVWWIPMVKLCKAIGGFELFGLVLLFALSGLIVLIG